MHRFFLLNIDNDDNSWHIHIPVSNLKSLNNQAKIAWLLNSETVINDTLTWWRTSNMYMVCLFNSGILKKCWWFMWWTLDSTLYNRAI